MYQLLPHLRCNFDLSPEPGKIHILTGENGIGKTTFLHHLYSSGTNFVLSEQKSVDFFFDRPLSRFYEILMEDSKTLDRELFSRLWQESGLKQKDDRLLSQLSGGEGQLLKLISQCSVNADIFLIDEPGQYLDREKKKFAASVLSELLRKKAGIVAIDHDLSWFPEGSIVHELVLNEDTLSERKQWTI